MPMNELHAQKLFVDAVKEAGGAAHKLSHRFLVGIPDLLVKLPGVEAVLLEAKLQKVGRTTKDDFQFALDVTVPQKNVLRSYARAGMRTGVLSFVERGGLGKRGLFVAAFLLDQLEAGGYNARVSDHELAFIDGKERMTNVMKRGLYL